MSSLRGRAWDYITDMPLGGDKIELVMEIIKLQDKVARLERELDENHLGQLVDMLSDRVFELEQK